MDEYSSLNRDDGQRIFQQVISHFNAPAYIRRARRTEEAFTTLVASCRRVRAEWLTMVAVYLGTLRGQAGSWDRLLPWLADAEQLGALARLWEAVQPDLQIRIEPTTSARKLRRSLASVVTEVEAFNHRWAVYLPTVDRSGVNQLREGYNRWYVFEKECAVRSLAVARQGFQPLEPLTIEDLIEALPLLPTVRLKM
jgi:hypothetical protein